MNLYNLIGELKYYDMSEESVREGICKALDEVKEQVSEMCMDELIYFIEQTEIMNALVEYEGDDGFGTEGLLL